MQTLMRADYETVLKIVREWPSSQRFTLVQDVLQTLSPASYQHQASRNTLAQALGLLATGEPVLSDDDVERWLDERRSERFEQ